MYAIRSYYDGRNVQFDGAGVDRDLPAAEIERAAEGGGSVAHADGHRADDRSFDRVDSARDVGRNNFV